MSLELRPYQAQCVERAVASNTIVSLPTGKGKTLIAVRVVDHFLQRDVDKHAIFLVPTKALVSQQAAYCEQHCESRPRVARLSGMEMEAWDEVKWRSCLEKFRVLVGTPEVFRRAMDQGFLDAAQISLLVFDECHHAKGNSPMAALMLDHVSKLDELSCPRILGLTASFLLGSLKRKRDAEKARVELELLLKSAIFCPEIQDDASLAGVPVGDRGEKWLRVAWEEESYASTFQNEVGAPLKGVFEKLDNVANVKELNKTATRMEHVFSQLGRSALLVYVRTCIVRQLERQVQDLLTLRALGPADREQFEALLGKLPLLQELLVNLANKLTDVPCVKSAPELSRKVLALHLLLQREELAAGKGIVFVEQVALTVPLAGTINEHVKRSSGAVYGQMVKQDIDAVIKNFRSGQTRILVATKALEEGIDVDDCDWVVRFDKFGTTKSHIQGSGRARSKAARIYYFDNDPGEEQSKAVMLSGVAKSEELSLTEQERLDLEEARRPKLAVVEGVYPFGGADGQEVHLFNCLEIVYEWCQQVLGASFKSEDIYRNEDEKLTVSFPTSQGMETISGEDVDKYWGHIPVSSVIPKARGQAMTRQEQERRRALFVVAVKLRQRGMLDRRNTADTKQLMLAQGKCQSDKPAPPKLSLNGSFGRHAQQVRAGNFKNALQEMLQQRYPRLTMREILAYENVMTDDGWQSTARILPSERSFQSSTLANKKAAEQDAAKRAYETLMSEK